MPTLARRVRASFLSNNQPPQSKAQAHTQPEESLEPVMVRDDQTVRLKEEGHIGEMNPLKRKQGKLKDRVSAG
jgi:hypothetical protein